MPDTTELQHYPVGTEVIVSASDHGDFHAFPGGTRGVVREEYIRSDGTRTYRVTSPTCSFSCANLNDTEPYESRDGQWVDPRNLTRAEPDLHVGDTVHVASWASMDPDVPEGDPRGWVDPRFFDKDATVEPRSGGSVIVDGTVRLRLDDGDVNYIHWSYLTLVRRPWTAGTKVRVADWASTLPRTESSDELRGYVDPAFFGKVCTIVRSRSDNGTYRVALDELPGRENTVHESYLSLLGEETTEAPVPDRSGEPLDQAAVDAAIAEFKKQVEEVTLRRARRAGIDMSVVRGALAEWGITPQHAAHRVTGTLSFSVPFDVTLTDEEWEPESSAQLERYIRARISDYQEVSFDHGLEDNEGSAYADGKSVEIDAIYDEEGEEVDL